MGLTDERFEDYQRERSIVSAGMLPGDEVELQRSRLEEYIPRERQKQEFDRMVESDVRGGKFLSEDEPVRKFQGVGLIHDDDVFRDLAFCNRIVDVENPFQGPNLMLLWSVAMLKLPGVGSAKKVHQDVAYYPIHPIDHVTAWVALDEAPPEDGYMQTMVGAYTDSLLPQEEFEYDTDLTRAEHDTMALPMELWAALFQHWLVSHYTATNESDRWHRTMAVVNTCDRSPFTMDDQPDWVDNSHATGDQFSRCV